MKFYKNKINQNKRERNRKSKKNKRFFKIHRQVKGERGQGLVEYMIIVALMAVATMGVIRVLSQTTSVKFAQIIQSLQGRGASSPIEYDRVEEQDFKKKDMSDFFHGTRSRKRR